MHSGNIRVFALQFAFIDIPLPGLVLLSLYISILKPVKLILIRILAITMSMVTNFAAIATYALLA
jgi:hypothetical protein